jgi:hypothetical protein
MKLQDNVSGNISSNSNAKGAIWQVLPVFGQLLEGFEGARQRHKPFESQISIDPPNRANSPTLSPPPTQSQTRPTNTRRRQRAPIGEASARATTAAVTSKSDITTPAASQITAVDDFVQSQINADFVTLEHHFSTKINAAWQKLNDHYTRTNTTPIYRAAVFLHPRLEWRWFERCWETKSSWIVAAREAFINMWNEYKTRYANNSPVTVPHIDEDDEWSHYDVATADQLALYKSEPYSQLLTAATSRSESLGSMT